MKKWAYVEQGIIKELHDELPQNWQSISNFYALASDTGYLKGLGWNAIEDRTQTYDETTQMVINDRYELVDGTVIGVGDVVPKPMASSGNPTEVIGGYSIEVLEPLYQSMDYSARKAIFLTLLRAERDRRISMSDWTQLTDIILIRSNTWTTAWRAYRQDLRDLPDAYLTNELTDINGVIWPVAPSSANIPDPVITPEPAQPVNQSLDSGVVTAAPTPEPTPEVPTQDVGLNLLDPVLPQDAPADPTTDVPVDSTTNVSVDSTTTDVSVDSTTDVPADPPA